MSPLELPEDARNDLPNFTRVLQARTQREGLSNPDSLYLLGQAFLQLQVPDQALIALRRAHELAPQRADITLAYAQAELIDNDGRLTPAAERLLNTVLAAQPNNRGALMLLGFGAFSSGAYDRAIGAWQRLLDQVDPNTEAARLLRNSIDQAEQRLAAGDDAAPAGPVDAIGARIAVTVDLAPELQARLDPEDTLFIFARAAAGPPMPLAAIRQPARDFPVSVVLDDSRAMLPEMKLSNFDDVVIGARISRAGDVTARPGDMEGLTNPLSLRNGPLSVSLTVDRIVQ
jgi:cytochrome c-type biogenesis protein CcmH